MCLSMSLLQADVRAEMDSVNTVKFNLTADAIEAIFRTYPSGRQCVRALDPISLQWLYIRMQNAYKLIYIYHVTMEAM